MQELLQRVQVEHNRFDLAYVPFDYPDDWYPYALGAALDVQATGRGGRNWFHFQSPATNPDADDLQLGQLLMGLRNYCDVSGVLAARAADAGKRFNDSLPFIPLWQLDRHTVIHNSLKVFVEDTTEPVNPRLLNPTTLFQGVARWRLD
jgi:peptide/nickel transport system substrate-binding protein